MGANTWQQPEDNPETDFLSEPLVEASPANTFLLDLHPPIRGEKFLLFEVIQLVLFYYAAADNGSTLSYNKAERPGSCYVPLSPQNSRKQETKGVLFDA